MQKRNAILLGLRKINEKYDDLFRNPVKICDYVENEYTFQLRDFGLTDDDIDFLYQLGLSHRERIYQICKMMKEREIAATKIQLAYLKSYYNPKFELCKRRLIRQFNSIYSS